MYLILCTLRKCISRTSGHIEFFFYVIVKKITCFLRTIKIFRGCQPAADLGSKRVAILLNLNVNYNGLKYHKHSIGYLCPRLCPLKFHWVSYHYKTNLFLLAQWGQDNLFLLAQWGRNIKPFYHTTRRNF